MRPSNIFFGPVPHQPITHMAKKKTKRKNEKRRPNNSVCNFNFDCSSRNKYPKLLLLLVCGLFLRVLIQTRTMEISISFTVDLGPAAIIFFFFARLWPRIGTVLDMRAHFRNFRRQNNSINVFASHFL